MTQTGFPLSGDGIYRLSLESRATGGAEPRVCVWQRGPDRCAELEMMRGAHGWQQHDLVVRTDPGTTGLTLYLYAKGATHATVSYRDVTLVPERLVGSGGGYAAARGVFSERWLAAGPHTLTHARAAR